MRVGTVSSDQLRKPVHGGDSTSLHARHHLPISREQELEALAYETASRLCTSLQPEAEIAKLDALPAQEQNFVRNILIVIAYRLNLKAEQIRSKGCKQ